MIPSISSPLNTSFKLHSCHDHSRGSTPSSASTKYEAYSTLPAAISVYYLIERHHLHVRLLCVHLHSQAGNPQPYHKRLYHSFTKKLQSGEKPKAKRKKKNKKRKKKSAFYPPSPLLPFSASTSLAALSEQHSNNKNDQPTTPPSPGPKVSTPYSFLHDKRVEIYVSLKTRFS